MVSKKKLVIGAVAGIVVVAVIVIVTVFCLLLIPCPGDDNFKKNFMEKCEAFQPKNENCANILDTFEKAYVSKTPLNFAEKNYEEVIAVAPFTHPSDKTMFWSDTKDLVQDFTKMRECFYTLEETLLGYVLDGKKWCECDVRSIRGIKTLGDTPVSAFWSAASRKFAQHASGTVTVMLNGQNKEPFSPNSVLGSVEIPNLQAGRVTKVNVYVITDENKGQCNKQSIKNLCSSLNKRQIGCFCYEVTKSQLEKCIAENTPCGACWAGLRDSKSNDTIRQDTT